MSISAPALVAALVLAVGPTALGWPNIRESSTQTYDLSAAGSIAIENSSGDVHVVGWDRNQVSLTTVKTAWSKDDLARLQAMVQSRSDGFAVRALYPDNCFNCDISFVMHAPRGAHLTVDSSSGDVKVELVTGPVRVETSSGDIEVHSVSGQTHLHSSSGGVSIDSVNGPIAAATSSGDIDATNLAGDVDFVAASGDINAEFAKFDAVRSIRLATSSGSITLRVPRSAGFKIEAVTSSGSIDSNLNLPIRDKDSGADVAAQVGDGRATAQLQSTSGDIGITMR